jgi:2-succinyl-5-enolpyruvyl-6-hydroxy-3-cyclohexene-1-carboxylate synthase
VRNLDQFGAPRPQKVDIYCNRGASGIDGTLASAAGVAAADPDRWLALLSGDLAFLHDLNSLLLIKAYTPRMLIVVVNNDGGGIFQRLPVSNFEPYFTPLFLTPHGLNFAGAATMFGLEYCKVSDRAGLQEQLRDKFVNPRPALLEVQGDAVVHEMMRREFQRRLELMQ